MIKIFTAYTQEFDNAERALGEILNQLDIKNNLRKNTVAVVFCHSKFIENGITAAVCKNLPFNILGCTSQYFAMSKIMSAKTPAVKGEIMLVVTVITSDDTEFVTGLSDPLCKNTAEANIQSLYKKTSEALGAEPSLMFAFQPSLPDLTGDAMTEILDHACGEIPVFGAVALDIDTRIRNPKTIYGDAAYGDRMSLLLFKGPVKPRFFYSFIPEKFVIPQDAVITAAENNRIISVNNEPAAAFVKELGFFQYNEKDSDLTIPLITENNDGTGPQAVVILGMSPEGELICNRVMNSGEVLGIGMMTSDYVLESAAALVQDIKNNGNGADFFIFSCFLRSNLLGGSHKDEIELIEKELEGFPGSCLFISSAGEICPRYIEFGKTRNRMYAYAIIACQF